MQSKLAYTAHSLCCGVGGYDFQLEHPLCILQICGHYEAAAAADEQATQSGHRGSHLDLLVPHLLPHAVVFQDRRGTYIYVVYCLASVITFSLSLSITLHHFTAPKVPATKQSSSRIVCYSEWPDGQTNFSKHEYL